MHGSVHYVMAYGVSMLGFCLIGLILGVLASAILAPIGILYQFFKVLILLCGGLCCSKGVREDDNDSLYDSMYSKSNYMSLETG